MNIVELNIKGFRSLKDVVWCPGDLNVIIGPNGTGKSNLLRALELISISAQGQLGKYIQASGGMDPLVWDGQAPGVSFKIAVGAVDGLYVDHTLTYNVELERLRNTSTFRIGDEMLGDYYRVKREEKSEPFKYIERHQHYARIFDDAERALTAPAESLLEDETLLSQLAGPFQANKLIQEFQKQLASWTIYHDLHVNRDAAIRQAAISRTERRVASDGQNLISVLHTLYTEDRYFKQAINSAMHAAFGNDFEELIFPPAADQRIQLRVRWKTLRREQSAADLSDGTLRFLFLLTVLASPSAAPLIAIDEPETGLHPSMLPVIAEYAVDASRRSQLIITTHSDQFLDAFGETKPTTTVAKWSDGETILNTLNSDALAYWLKEYSLGALYRSRELENMV